MVLDQTDLNYLINGFEFRAHYAKECMHLTERRVVALASIYALKKHKIDNFYGSTVSRLIKNATDVRLHHKAIVIALESLMCINIDKSGKKQSYRANSIGLERDKESLHNFAATAYDIISRHGLSYHPERTSTRDQNKKERAKLFAALQDIDSIYKLNSVECIELSNMLNIIISPQTIKKQVLNY